jgi:hypothetical protein
MKRARHFSKRPCRVCKRWFKPDARLGDRQKTCGDAACKKEWHRRKCAEWNKKNSEYAKTNALYRKIEAAKNPADSGQPASSGGSRSLLPRGYVKEVIEVQLVVILEYLGQQLLRRLQEVIKRQDVVNNRQYGRLPP